jgi:hypothetical protein
VQKVRLLRCARAITDGAEQLVRVGPPLKRRGGTSRLPPKGYERGRPVAF